MAVFSPVLMHDFVNFDDPGFVYANPYVQAGLTLDGIRWAFVTAHEANWIPLTWISHMLDVQLFGLKPAGHHAVNVLFHAASSCLLFLFLNRATGSTCRSLAVVALFALHPLRVESVAWVAERKDVLSTFFWMLTLNAYLHYSLRPDATRYSVVMVCFAVGLLTKPMIVTLPIVLLLLDWWPFEQYSSETESRTFRTASSLRLMVEKIPFFLLAGCSSAITYWAQHTSGESSQGYTFQSRLGKACIAYMEYLYKMIWPVDLSVLYPFSKYPPSTTKIFFSAFVLLLITGVVFWQRKRYPFFISGWLWYLVTLLPVIGLIQIGQHSIADRYTYIPLTGVFVMLVWGVSRFLEKWPFRNAVLGTVSLGLLTGMIALTLLQLRYWKNSYSLFTHTIEVTRDNWVAHNNLGLVMYADGRLDDAIYQYKLAIKAKPSYTIAYINLGVVYRKKREYIMSEEAFTWVLKLDPGNQLAHYNLGLLYLDIGKIDSAQQQYQKLVDFDSPYAENLLKAISQIGTGSSPAR